MGNCLHLFSLAGAEKVTPLHTYLPLMRQRIYKCVLYLSVPATSHKRQMWLCPSCTHTYLPHRGTSHKRCGSTANAIHIDTP